MSMLTAVARWAAGRRDLDAGLSSLEHQLAKKRAEQPRAIDPAEHRRWNAEVAGLEADILAHKGAIAIAVAEHAKAEAAEQSEMDAAEAKAMERLAAENAKLARKIAADAVELAAKRDALAAADAPIAEYNSRRGSRPAVVDGETRARRQPARTLPATYREEVRWLMPDGRRASIFRTDERGEQIPVEAGFARTVVRVEQQAESVIPERMPERFASALVLVDLAGNRI